MSHDIYDILGRLQPLKENINPSQRQVKQLPALFQPKKVSPVLDGPYGKDNATQGYLVGESQGDDNPMAQALIRRIAGQRPEWLMQYGVEAVMQAVDDVTEGDRDWEEIGTSDVSAYMHRVQDYLRDWGGDRTNVAEEVDTGEADARKTTPSSKDDKEKVFAKHRERVKNLDKDDDKESTTEDVLSTVKKKLGDYLQDVAAAIKTDPDLVDKIDQAVDQIGPAVKTIKTDDGHEIKIHGNEDDGFRISIKNQPSKTKFKNLDEATMACEMYCAHRRNKAMTADYIEEKHIS